MGDWGDGYFLQKNKIENESVLFQGNLSCKPIKYVDQYIMVNLGESNKIPNGSGRGGM
jgi:hypothetical protein